MVINFFFSASSYADGVSKDISGKFDVGSIELYIECYGENPPSIIVHSGFNGYGSEGEWGAVIQKISQKNRICIYIERIWGKVTNYRKPKR